MLHSQVFLCGLKILTQGQDATPRAQQGMEGLTDFLMGFTKAEHETGLGGNRGIKVLNVPDNIPWTRRVLINATYVGGYYEAKG